MSSKLGAFVEDVEVFIMIANASFFFGALLFVSAKPEYSSSKSSLKVILTYFKVLSKS